MTKNQPIKNEYLSNCLKKANEDLIHYEKFIVKLKERLQFASESPSGKRHLQPIMTDLENNIAKMENSKKDILETIEILNKTK